MSIEVEQRVPYPDITIHKVESDNTLYVKSLSTQLNEKLTRYRKTKSSLQKIYRGVRGTAAAIGISTSAGAIAIAGVMAGGAIAIPVTAPVVLGSIAIVSLAGIDLGVAQRLYKWISRTRTKIQHTELFKARLESFFIKARKDGHISQQELIEVDNIMDEYRSKAPKVSPFTSVVEDIPSSYLKPKVKKQVQQGIKKALVNELIQTGVQRLKGASSASI